MNPLRYDLESTRLVLGVRTGATSTAPPWRAHECFGFLDTLAECCALGDPCQRCDTLCPCWRPDSHADSVRRGNALEGVVSTLGGPRLFRTAHTSGLDAVTAPPSRPVLHPSRLAPTALTAPCRCPDALSSLSSLLEHPRAFSVKVLCAWRYSNVPLFPAARSLSWRGGEGYYVLRAHEASHGFGALLGGKGAVALRRSGYWHARAGSSLYRGSRRSARVGSRTWSADCAIRSSRDWHPLQTVSQEVCTFVSFPPPAGEAKTRLGLSLSCFQVLSTSSTMSLSGM